MLDHTLARQNSRPEQWIVPVGIGAVAVLVGVIVGQGLWRFLPAIGLLPLLWVWPVEVTLGAVVVLLPFEPITTRGMEGDRGVMSLAFVIALLVVFAIGVVGGRLQRPSVTAVWCGLFISWAGVSTLWAVDPQVSVKHLPTAIALFLFYLVASSFRITEKEFDWVVLLTILGGGAAALWSVGQFYSGVGFGLHDIRATLTVGETEANPNRFGIRLLLPLSFAIAYFLSARRWYAKTFALVLMVMAGLGLLLTMSRGSILAEIVIVLVFFFRLKSLKLKSVQPQVRRLLALVVLMAVFFAVAMPTALYLRFKEARDDRGAGRLDIWTVGVEILKHYPVAGAGFSNFPVVYNQYAGAAPHLYFKRDNNDAHNSYLAIAVEEGLVGLLLFGIAIKRQFSMVSKCRTQTVRSPVMLVACEAVFCGLLVASLFGNILWDKTFWLSWVFLGFAVTLQTSPSGLVRRGEAI